MSPPDRDAALAAPPWPVLQLVLDESGRGTVDGRTVEATQDGGRAALLAEATRRAADLGRLLRVRAVDPGGVWLLVAHPDGAVTEVPDDLYDLFEGGEGPRTSVDGPDAAAPALVDEAPGPWHLRVHPSGEIIEVDELPLPEEEIFPGPAPAWVPEAPSTPSTPVDLPATESEAEAGLQADGAAESAMNDDTVAEPIVAEPGPGSTSPPQSALAPDDGRHQLGDEPPLEPGAPEPGARQATTTSGADSLVDSMRAAVDLQRPGRGRRGWFAVLVAAVLGVLAIAALGVSMTDRQPSSARTASGPRERQPASPSAPSSEAGARAGAPAAVLASPPPRLASPPATLAIGPAPGFVAKPVWALPVFGSGSSTVSADGRIVTLTADRQIALVDPGTGAVRWHAKAPDEAAGPYLSRIDGKPVVAMLTTSLLLYWPLPDQGVPAAGAVAPVEVALPAGSSVSWAGPSPLVRLADGAVGVVQGRAVQRVWLPTGAKPLAADGADVLAVTGRNWIRQTVGQQPEVPRQLAVPQGATGATPTRVENVGGSFLGAMWTSPGGPIVAVYDARTGTKLVQAAFPKDADFLTATTVREPGSDRTAVGTALFEPAQRNLSILASSFRPVALTPGHVFAKDVSGAVADLQIKGKDLKAVRFPGANPTVPIGITSAAARSLAVVVVPNGAAGWLMCALPPA